MSLNTICLFLALFLFSLTLIHAQTTYSNCKEIAGGYKVEWTADETNDKLSARFTVPNSSGYAAVGVKSAGVGMDGATIWLAEAGQQVEEYYASANGAPSQLSVSPFFTSASSSKTGTSTVITLVRSLKRPATAPATYFEFVRGASTNLLFAAHSSASFPTKHDDQLRVSFDFFTASTCAQPQPTQKPKTSSLVTPTNSTSTHRNNEAMSHGIGNELLIFVTMFIAYVLAIY